MRTTTQTAWRWGLTGVLLVAVLGGLTGTTTARGATLRWKFRPGETLHYEMDQSVVTSIKGIPQDFKTTTTQKISMAWTVKEVGADGVASLTQTVTRVRSKVEAALGTFDYDSQAAKEPEGPVAAAMVPMLKSLVGAEFSFKMTPQGELSDVKVPESVLKVLREAGPVAGGAMYSEEGLKNMVTESSLALPKDDLEVGRNWHRQIKLPMPPIGAMTINKTYSFQGPDPSAGKGMVRIDLDTKIDVQPTADNKIDVTVKSQAGKGSFFFDNTAGRISDSRVSEAIELVFKVGAAEVTQSNETTTRMTLGKVDPPGTPAVTATDDAASKAK